MKLNIKEEEFRMLVDIDKHLNHVDELLAKFGKNKMKIALGNKRARARFLTSVKKRRKQEQEALASLRKAFSYPSSAIHWKKAMMATPSPSASRPARKRDLEEAVASAHPTVTDSQKTKSDPSLPLVKCATENLTHSTKSSPGVWSSMWMLFQVLFILAFCVTMFTGSDLPKAAASEVVASVAQAIHGIAAPGGIVASLHKNVCDAVCRPPPPPTCLLF